MKMPHRPGYIAQVHTLYSVSTFSIINEVLFIISERSSFLVLIFCKFIYGSEHAATFPPSRFGIKIYKWLCGSCPNTGVITRARPLVFMLNPSSQRAKGPLLCLSDFLLKNANSNLTPRHAWLSPSNHFIGDRHLTFPNLTNISIIHKKVNMYIQYSKAIRKRRRGSRSLGPPRKNAFCFGDSFSKWNSLCAPKRP